MATKRPVARDVWAPMIPGIGGVWAPMIPGIGGVQTGNTGTARNLRKLLTARGRRRLLAKAAGKARR